MSGFVTRTAIAAGVKRPIIRRADRQRDGYLTGWAAVGRWFQEVYWDALRLGYLEVSRMGYIEDVGGENTIMSLRTLLRAAWKRTD